jgi:hypothetical protein
MENSSTTLHKALDSSISFSSTAWLAKGATIFNQPIGTLLVDNHRIWFSDENGLDLFSLELNDIKSVSFPTVGNMKIFSKSSHAYLVSFAQPFKIRWTRNPNKLQQAFDIAKQWAVIMQPYATTQPGRDLYTSRTKIVINILKVIIIISIMLVILRFVITGLR